MTAKERLRLQRDMNLILSHSKTFHAVTCSVIAVVKKSASNIRKKLRDTAKQVKS